MIRPARPGDLPRLREVERAAGRAFADVGMGAVAGHEPAPLDVLAGYQRDGRAWVAVDSAGGDEPVGFLLVELVDGAAHVEQVSVHPDAAGRRLGSALLNAAAAWAAEHGVAALTLTTFADVPWNAPYYARLGFQVVPDDRLGEGLRRVREHESALGLDPWPRVVMRRAVPATG